ncbi:Zn(II)2Cys6 transcription factor domain-containing protein [Aspergillus candidus]|uniref:Zn(2)-C6 fungal-type domain-containing protein n=1 Tax=Aspergillus candidus TaxID=41067 RepID=A0A2I2FNH8_ASPCN|nr:hypothetical protein BDW47DRAFT_98019 [Aspergillus candidus]PLB42189.1 hypothetical protein BDW47DRAFT_98019 [Aspergillus candidus]
MPPRRTHTKSRNGCVQCKKRRVKCDEQGPPCSNCISRELLCTYVDAPRTSNVNGPSAGPTPLQLESTSRTADLADNRSNSLFQAVNLRALELMHQFSTETYRSLCSGPADDHFWRRTMPRRALDCDFLMCGILAVASLHIASLREPPEALSYIDTALEYHTQAFAPFRRAIDNLTPSNCDVVFAYSVILIVIGIALPQMTMERETKSSMTENIIVVSELLRGPSNIVRISRPWLKEKLDSKSGFWDIETSELDPETNTALDELTSLGREMASTMSVEHQHIFQGAIDVLRNCFSRYSAAKDSTPVVAWLAEVDKEFFCTLRRREPLALLILMHWAVLLGELDGKMWWAKNSAPALVSEILEALRSSGIQWKGPWLWPKKRLGL